MAAAATAAADQLQEVGVSVDVTFFFYLGSFLNGALGTWRVTWLQSRRSATGKFTLILQSSKHLPMSTFIPGTSPGSHRHQFHLRVHVDTGYDHGDWPPNMQTCSPPPSFESNQFADDCCFLSLLHGDVGKVKTSGNASRVVSDRIPQEIVVVEQSKNHKAPSKSKRLGHYVMQGWRHCRPLDWARELQSRRPIRRLSTIRCLKPTIRHL